MRLPAALTRPLGRLGNLAALAFVVVLAFQAGQQWEIARGNRLPHFDRTTAGTTWCDRDAYHIAYAWVPIPRASRTSSRTKRSTCST